MKHETRLLDDLSPGIEMCWELLPAAPEDAHDRRFLKILRKHGFASAQAPVPLVGRYSKGRRWTNTEFDICYKAWCSGKSLTLIAATLNRNPQDMIYKLLRRCRQSGPVFSQRGRSEGNANWTPPVAQCAAELFEAGLPAWKIAVLFRVDFEFVEKAVFLGRPKYGHDKKNPFAICTDHKQIVNQMVIAQSKLRIRRVLDPFAGEGRFSRIVETLCPTAEITAIECDPSTFARAMKRSWPNAHWTLSENQLEMEKLRAANETFDLIDLDPFVSCRDQLVAVWPLLQPDSLLFITLGGEYRRSFIGSNRKAIEKRYGFTANEMENRQYLREVPSFFIGWVAEQAAKNSYVVELIRAVRYPNNCRFWTYAKRVSYAEAQNWLCQATAVTENGRRWQNLEMPRFREIRFELDDKNSSQYKLAI